MTRVRLANVMRGFPWLSKNRVGWFQPPRCFNSIPLLRPCGSMGGQARPGGGGGDRGSIGILRWRLAEWWARRKNPPQGSTRPSAKVGR